MAVLFRLSMMMFSVVLLYLCTVVTADDLSAPKNCKEICITMFDGSEEDACSRGCEFTESCADTYKLDAKLVAACKVGCETSLGRSSITFRLLPIQSFFGTFLDRIRQLFGVNDGPEVSLDSKASNVNSNTGSDSGNHVVISRVRILHNFVPFDAPENLLESFGMKPLINSPEFMPQNNDVHHKAPRVDDRNIIGFRTIQDEDESYEHRPTAIRRVTYFFRHIMLKPLLLPFLIALLLVILLLMVKLTIHACRLREHHNIEYTRLPTYIEAVNVKVPLCEDRVKSEKCEKAPVDA
ncbi:unnamed protein product [Heterobilharzia americana]|nr:unnamed protein product [Heterobilharzia americana]